MCPAYLAVCTDGNIWISNDLDQLKTVANIAHLYQVVGVGRTPVLLATYSGAASPYTCTSGADPFTAGQEVILQ